MLGADVASVCDHEVLSGLAENVSVVTRLEAPKTEWAGCYDYPPESGGYLSSVANSAVCTCEVGSNVDVCVPPSELIPVVPVVKIAEYA